MNSESKCPNCGGELAPGASPGGLCARCLMNLGMSDDPANTRDKPGRTGTLPLSESDPLSISALGEYFPKLEIEEMLGRGGMGVVYKARQPSLDRWVALKILHVPMRDDSDFADRFATEAKSLARLSHPGIVGVHDFGHTAGFYYLIMEYVDGANLRTLIESGEMTPKLALRIVPKICEALEYAHEEGIVHRDIKPENVLVDKKGRVKIADFGLAKILSRRPEDSRPTRSHQVMGTPHYMAPEQIEDPLNVDHRADIYSLGVVFYELLTGELPLGRFAAPSEKVQIDVRLDEVVLRTLEKEPDRRYQSAGAIATDIDRVTGASLVYVAAQGYEYRSRATVWGIPLVHVVFGRDPRTGRRRLAKGIIAVGEIAVGVVAFGNFALGVFSFGVVSIGLLFASGAVGLGGVAVGALALGGVAAGGLAIGLVSMGAVAWGYYAMGATAAGAHVISTVQQDPQAIEFFGRFFPTLIESIQNARDGSG